MKLTDHRATLATYGFSPADIERIEALWAEVTDLTSPAAISDLSIPYRVGACKAIDAHRFSGLPVASWGGRTVLVWKLRVGREMEAWERTRKRPRR